MSIYDTNSRNTSRAVEGPVTLDGLDDVTIRMMALYVIEKPDDLERRLEMSAFASRCGVLHKLKRHVRELEADA